MVAWYTTVVCIKRSNHDVKDRKDRKDSHHEYEIVTIHVIFPAWAQCNHIVVYSYHNKWDRLVGQRKHHWKIITITFSVKAEMHNIGGSRGRARRTPPMGPNSFIFAYIFTEKCPRRRSMPPLTGARPPLREILDPPLHKCVFSKELLGDLKWIISNGLFRQNVCNSCNCFDGLLTIHSCLFVLFLIQSNKLPNIYDNSKNHVWRILFWRWMYWAG